MLPLSVQVPASVVLLAGGAVACFGGYRLFKLVLGVYGFILGAMIGSYMVGTSQPWATVVAALAGGAIGALVLIVGSFVGVAILGAGLAALIVNVAWKPFGGEPHPAALIVAAAAGAFLAMAFQRHLIIASTAFAGSWTMLVGAAALMKGAAGRAASASADVWVLYPNSAVADGYWVYAVWVAIALFGMYVQLHTSKKPAKKSKKKAKDDE
jgi:hypothetical protein